MEIRNLLTFIQVAELNSFTKAGSALGYSQSTVSFQIKQLETELDCMLFERINHTLTLTDKGAELLEYAHQICRLTDEYRQCRQSSRDIRGSVHVVTSDSIVETMIRRSYIEFSGLYPGISLRFSTAGTGDMLEMLGRNEADICLTLDQHVYNRDYVIVREQRMGVHFVAGSGSPFASRAEISIHELPDLPFYLTEKGMGYRKVLDELLEKKSVEIRPVLELSRTDLITELLEQNNAVSFLPDFVTEQKVRAGKITRLNVPGAEADIWKQMIHHKNKWISNALEAFISYAATHDFVSENS